MNEATIRNLTLEECEREGLIPEFLQPKIKTLRDIISNLHSIINSQKISLERTQELNSNCIMALQDIVEICKESPTSKVSKSILSIIETSGIELS